MKLALHLISETGTVTYADPRLDKKPAKISEIGHWVIPVKLKEGEQQSLLKGELTWQKISENGS